MAEIVLPEIVPIAALAGLLGVTSRQARNLLDSAKVKPAARGEWPLAAAVQAILAHARQHRDTSELARARARAVNAQARERELKIGKQERELIPLEDAIAAVDLLAGTVRQELDGLPARATRDARRATLRGSKPFASKSTPLSPGLRKGCARRLD